MNINYHDVIEIINEQIDLINEDLRDYDGAPTLFKERVILDTIKINTLYELKETLYEEFEVNDDE